MTSERRADLAILLIVPIVMASGIAARRSRRAGWFVLGIGAVILAGVTPVMYEARSGGTQRRWGSS